MSALIASPTSVWRVAHLVQPVAYGAAELKLAAHRNAFLALSISILIHFSIIGFYFLSSMVESDEPIPKGPHNGPIITYDPSPRIPGISTPPAINSPAIPRPRGRDGIPVPVADQPNVNETIPSQDDRRRLVDPQETNFPSGPAGERPVIDVDDGPPPIFVPVEKEPIIVKAVPPIYPPLALRAGIAGKVYMKLWVDRQGKVRQVEIVKSDNDIFNEAAIEAAKQFVFAPAYMNNGPVSVWVGMPITFKLTGP